MALTNINLLQKLAYTGTDKDLQKYSDIYLKQALANLGQRFSIKGDGVTSGKFAIYELMPTLPVPVEEDFAEYGKLYDAYMMATVQEDDDSLDIQLTAYCIKDSEGQYYSKTTQLSEKDYVILEDALYMQGAKVPSVNQATPIAYYGEGTLITDDGNDIWKVAGKDLSYNNEFLDGSFNIYDYDKGRIEGGFRVYEADGEMYATHLSYVSASSTGEAFYRVTQYSLDVTSVSEAWNLIMDETSGPIMPGNLKKTWTDDDIVEALDGLITYLGQCDAVMNADSHQISCDSDTFEGAFGSNTTIGDIVEANVLQWNEQVSKELSLFRTYYNTEQYFGTDDNLKLKKRIVAEILAQLYYNYLDESQGEGAADSVFVALMPYEYEFIYTCNAQNPSQIYTASRDVIVESLQNPFDELWKICQTGNNGVREQHWICSSWDTADSTEDIYSVWKYFLTYDKDDLLNAVNVIRTYVLPYINDDGYWNINNVDTDIYARGKDGGQPSIIISYSDTYTGQHEILSTMHKDELTTALDWTLTYYHVRPLDTSTTIGTNSFHMMTTYMPSNISTAYLHENLVTFLENAIIMDVASVHNEDSSQSTTGVELQDPQELGENATVTTFWALTKDPQTSEYYFTYVKQPDTSWAIDFNYLTDAEAIVKYYMQKGMQPDVYRHRWLVFSGIEASLKNQANAAASAMVYPTWINRRIDSFDDMFNVEETADNRYLNNLNFMFAFYNDLEWNGSYIAAVHDKNDGRFFRFDYYEDIDPDTGAVTAYHYVPVAQALKATGVTVDEWYPNTRVSNTYIPGSDPWLDTLLPIMDFKEAFLRNMSVLNRYNILSTDSLGRMYYSYIGTTPDSANKGILHIGTGNEDINLGLRTLTDEHQRSYFESHYELDIDFPTIVLNGDVIMPKAAWTVFVDPEDADNKMWQSHYEMAYISHELPRDYTSLEEVAAIDTNARPKYFRIPKMIGGSNTNIGGGISVAPKTTFVSYVNVNWLCQDILKLTGWTNEKLRAEDGFSCFAYGEAGRLFWVHDYENTPSYFLQLTTDICDTAEKLYDYDDGTGQIIYFIKPNALDLSYLSRVSRRGTVTHVRLNIRECQSTHSTAYTIYDGGELDG